MRRVAALLLTVFAIVAALLQHSYAQSDMAMVRVMHASPDAPAVDVYVNGDAALTNAPLFALSDSLSVPAGTYRIQVVPTGARLGSAVLDATLPLNAGTAYTIAAVNKVAAIEPLVMIDDTSPVLVGKPRVRILQASPDAPAVDIKLAGTSMVVLGGAAFRDSAYLEVDKGTYRFDISPAGSSDVIFTTPELRFESGWIYTLVASGFLTQPNTTTHSALEHRRRCHPERSEGSHICWAGDSSLRSE